MGISLENVCFMIINFNNTMDCVFEIQRKVLYYYIYYDYAVQDHTEQ